MAVLFPQFCLAQDCDVMFPRDDNYYLGNGGLYLPMNTMLEFYDENGEALGEISKVNVYVIKYCKNKRMFQSAIINEIRIGSFETVLLMCDTTDTDYYKIYNQPHEFMQERVNIPDLSVVYISKKDVQLLEGQFYTYSELLFSDNLVEELQTEKNKASVGVNLAHNCMNLRAGPAVSYEKIFCIPGNDFGSLAEVSIIERSGQWAKVEVTYCDKYNRYQRSIWDSRHPDRCNCKKPKQHYTGWLKAIDDSGKPNIWFSANRN